MALKAAEWRQPNQYHVTSSHMSASSFLLSTYICILTLIGFVVVSDQFLHWFVIPIFFSGILIGMDAVDWMRGRLHIMDPVGILGLLGLHFFFLAPLLHVHLDHWMKNIESPPDWRVWLGAMAFLNLLGLLAYRIARTRISHSRLASTRTVWQIDRSRFLIVVLFALLVTGALQIRVYIEQGGISGYIQAFSAGLDAFQGMGWIFTISESFPILALLAFAVLIRKGNYNKSWVFLALVLLAFFVLKMLFGGLRGSRSNTIWGLFWAIGIIHYWIRPISKKYVFLGCVFLLLFMYFYGFYKGVGLDALRAFESFEDRAHLVETTGRSLHVVVLGDLARSDVQAFLLHRIVTSESDYEYAWGRTYLGAGALLIPKTIWPERPPSKVKEGTQVQYGMGAYVSGGWTSSRIYGLAGETMLNFGPVVVPLAFWLFGLAVASVRRMMVALQPNDSRLLLLPFLVSLCCIALVNDLDNVIFFSIKNGLVPFLIVLVSSVRRTHSD